MKIRFRYLNLILLFIIKYHLSNINTIIKTQYINYPFYKINQLSLYVSSFANNDYLTSNPLFKERIKNVIFMSKEYMYRKRSSFLSIVISTYERSDCLERIFNRLIKHRPPKTEIIISDDGSNSSTKKALLKSITENYINNDVYVIVHARNYGAFHTKLDGFLFSVGQFIMSIDDDDSFSENYYIELASHIIRSNSTNRNINFVIPTKIDFLFWVRFPVDIKKMIVNFHNHVTFAFRRSLMEDVDYPNQNITIVRDDAPLMIPLYAKSNDNQIYQYKNKLQYFVNQSICHTIHQDLVIKNNKQFKLNGLNFILYYIKKIGRNDLIPYVKRSYSY